MSSILPVSPRPPGVCLSPSLHCFYGGPSSRRERERENSLEIWTRSLRETGETGESRQILRLTWPLFNITNQIIITQKMMWRKASTLKKRILLLLTFFFLFLSTVLTLYWLLWHWVLILWSTPVFFLQSSCVPYFLPFIQWLARNWHWFDRKIHIGINK